MSALLAENALFPGLDSRGVSPTAGTVENLVRRAAEGWKKGLSKHSWLLGDLEELRRESPSGTTTQALEAAERFLVAWPASAPLPSLSLDPDGEISFDWAGPSGKVLTVSLREDGRLSFAARLAARRTRYGTDWFVDSVPRELIGLARLVCGA